ncbi:DUF2339 domain-containing protein [Iamia sp. SCSIO 61187]|uniref:glycosyltransferase 87 family protein n=1 Tax=Iamia sp. SCSIO 61187 TaxID=2722752 RepID=UPI001C632852|nr:glycosyltransferase 87 family protein [Iamia sp. SCSIO 61187]QYG93303.1 DUF2339 domain-containing protein [Iamia sp. SCSIO 61187]
MASPSSTAPVRVAAPSPSAVVADAREAPDRRRLLLLAVLVALVGVVLAGLAPGAISGLSALWLVTGVAVPLALAALRPRLGTVGLGLVLVLAVLMPAARTVTNVIDPPEGQLAAHDGGVIVTRAAAEDVVAGRNPYAADFSDDLPEVWRRLSVRGIDSFDNPIRSVYPYLPGAFLALTPLAAVSGADDLGDPRWVMLATFVAACVAIALRRTDAWRRAAALSAFSGMIVAVHLGYGTNDTWAASLFVLAALSLERRPRLAGLLLALAISVKFLLLPPVALWLAWRWRREGWAQIQRLWTLPAVLVATCLPFLLWSPADFLNDTLLFWLGRNDEPYPSSGFGLAAVAPDMVRGPVLALATVGFAVLGVLAAREVVRRWPHHPMTLPPAAALVVAGLLIPARTFQGNYLAMLAGLLATAWLVDRTPVDAADPVEDRAP